jgi:predicted DNA-binding protein (UPF0278 family)
MRGQHALFNVNQEYVCAVAPLLEHIDALTARLAEAERVTEEQVERAAMSIYKDALVTRKWEEVSEQLRNIYRDTARAALTAARGGG